VELARRARAAILSVMENDGGYDRESAARDGDAQVIRLRPLRVLVVSADHRFRAVIEMLMTRRGCSAFSCSAPESVAQKVIADRADVVLVDGVATLREVAQVIAQTDASLPPVGVVVVAERDEPVPAGLRALAKWGDFEELYAAAVEADRARARPAGQRASAGGLREARGHELG
jgi:DNA-binding response OmpR family regulator